MNPTLYLLMLLCLPITIFTQTTISWSEKASMPERVTNNAVTQATVGGIPFVYSFAGMDSTKSCNGDHLRAFRYNTYTNQWETIDPLPDPLGGKIAAAASTVKNKIYIIGGYHLSSGCNEVSSRKVHIYDPETNTYLPDGEDLPKAIDDHVQSVWQDSLIYVITGWSNTNNVFNVQIYNPTENEWLTGTSIPSQVGWRAFGASGTIVGDTIYYTGGAGSWNGSNFPPLNYLRKGHINPDNPADITWLPAIQVDAASGYRMGASSLESLPVWIGGSDITYNFDGIAYNGTGGVPALGRITTYNPQTGHFIQFLDTISPIMDLRGLAKVDHNAYIIAGGMEENQEVSSRTIEVLIDVFTGTNDIRLGTLEIFPNPAKDVFYLRGADSFQLQLFDVEGKLIVEGNFREMESIDISPLAAGVYTLKVLTEDGKWVVKKVMKAP